MEIPPEAIRKYCEEANGNLSNLPNKVEFHKAVEIPVASFSSTSKVSVRRQHERIEIYLRFQTTSHISN